LFPEIPYHQGCKKSTESKLLARLSKLPQSIHANHYAFTQDTNFLSTKAYPAMKSASDFWLSRLVTVSDSTLEAPDEWSSEQGPWESGVPYAQQLVWSLFTNTIKASQVLNVDTSYRSTLQTKLSQLVTGLCARGGFGVNITWDGHILTEAVIKSNNGNSCVVRDQTFTHPGQFTVTKVSDGSAVSYTVNGVMVLRAIISPPEAGPTVGVPLAVLINTPGPTPPSLTAAIPWPRRKLPPDTQLFRSSMPVTPEAARPMTTLSPNGTTEASGPPWRI
jgi:hypothetical protein